MQCAVSALFFCIEFVWFASEVLTGIKVPILPVTFWSRKSSTPGQDKLRFTAGTVHLIIGWKVVNALLICQVNESLTFWQSSRHWRMVIFELWSADGQRIQTQITHRHREIGSRVRLVYMGNIRWLTVERNEIQTLWDQRHQNRKIYMNGYERNTII